MFKKAPDSTSLCEFRPFHDRVAFTIERDDEIDRVTANGAILDEGLASAATWIDRDIIRLGATGAGVGGIAFKRHHPAVRRSHLGDRVVPMRIVKNICGRRDLGLSRLSLAPGPGAML